jgi:hypothetical protein
MYVKNVEKIHLKREKQFKTIIILVKKSSGPIGNSDQSKHLESWLSSAQFNNFALVSPIEASHTGYVEFNLINLPATPSTSSMSRTLF